MVDTAHGRAPRLHSSHTLTFHGFLPIGKPVVFDQKAVFMRPTLQLHEELLAAANSLEPLPTATVQLATLVNDPSATPSEIAAVIGTDPALAAHTLRDANSAIQGVRTPVGSLDQAVVRLGAARVLEIAMRAHLDDRIAADLPCYGIGGDAHRAQAVGASIAAEVLVRHSAVTIGNDVLCAALLHDLGKEVIDAVADPATADLLQAADVVDLEFEQEVVEADHAEIGAFVLESWHLPPSLVDAVRHHHHPAHSPEAATVCLAEGLCAELLPDGDVAIAIDPARIDAAAATLGIADRLDTVRLEVAAALRDAGLVDTID